MSTLRQVNVLDLTMAQIAGIEMDPRVSVPLARWGDDAPSQAALYTLIVAAGNGVPVEDVESLTLRELSELVDLGGEDDPTTPS